MENEGNDNGEKKKKLRWCCKLRQERYNIVLRKASRQLKTMRMPLRIAIYGGCGWDYGHEKVQANPQGRNKKSILIDVKFLPAQQGNDGSLSCKESSPVRVNKANNGSRNYDQLCVRSCFMGKCTTSNIFLLYFFYHKMLIFFNTLYPIISLTVLPFFHSHTLLSL